MRWAVELPAASGGTGPTVTVDAESWKNALTEARAGKTLTKFRVDFDEDGTVRAHDLVTNERFTLRPAVNAVTAVNAVSAVSAPSPAAPSVPAASAMPAASVSSPAAASAPSPEPPKPSVPPPSKGSIVPPPGPTGRPSTASMRALANATPVETAPPTANAQVVQSAPSKASSTETSSASPPHSVSSAALNATSNVPPDHVPPSHVSPAGAGPNLGPTVASAAQQVAPPAIAGPRELQIPAPATLFFARDREAATSNGLTYRERLLAVPPGTDPSQCTMIAREVWSQLRASLEPLPAGKFISIAVFDHVFKSRPERPPIIVLGWKDWRGDEPEITISRPSVTSIPAQSTSIPPNSFAPPPPSPSSSPPPGAAPIVLTATPPAPVEPSSAPPNPAPPTAPRPASQPSMQAVVPPPAGASVPPPRTTSQRSMTAIEAPARSTPSTEPEPPSSFVSTPSPSKNTVAFSELPASVAETLRQPPSAPEAETAPDTTATPLAQQATAQPTASVSTPIASVSSDTLVTIAPNIDGDERSPTPAPPSAKPPSVAADPRERADLEPPPTPLSHPVAPVPLVASAAAAIPLVQPQAPGAHGPTATPHSAPPAERVAISPVEKAPAAPAVAIRSTTAQHTQPVQRPRHRGDDLLSEAFEALSDMAFLSESSQAADFAMQVAKDLLHTSFVAISLYDIDRDELVVECCDRAPEARGRRGKIVKGELRSDVARRNSPSSLTAWQPEALLAEAPPGPALLVPISLDRRLFGVLEAHRALGEPPFEQDEEGAASYIAEQLARFLLDHSKRIGFQDDKSSRRR
jgi:hypothetical protein